MPLVRTSISGSQGPLSRSAARTSTPPSPHAGGMQLSTTKPAEALSWVSVKYISAGILLVVGFLTISHLTRSGASLRSNTYHLRAHPDMVVGPEGVPASWRKPKFIHFGDSLTERGFAPSGWTAQLADMYMRKVDVVNRGFGGYNTKWALELVDPVFQEFQNSNVALATLWFGANDAALIDGPKQTQPQHVPLKEYSKNLEALVGKMQQYCSCPILLITPPPVHVPGRYAYRKEKFGEENAHATPIDRTDASAALYAAAMRDVATRHRLPCVDLHSKFRAVLDANASAADAVFVDGLHFTALGQDMVFKFVSEKLLEEFPHLHPDKLPLHMPAWDSINPSDPHSTFAETQELSNTRKDGW